MKKSELSAKAKAGGITTMDCSSGVLRRCLTYSILLESKLKNKHDGTVKNAVIQDIKNGMTIEQVVKKYDVSEYYVKLWTREIYKKVDLDNYVRRRYKYIAVAAREKIEYQLGNCMSEEDFVSEESWEKFDEVLKQAIYDFAKELIKMN